MEVKGKVAFVTGAAMRVGRVIALMLAEKGMHVAISYLSDQEPWQETLAEIQAHGVEGMALEGSAGIDLVISDIIMPDMEGIETIARFRAQRPDLPIIAISGGGRLRRDAPLAYAKELGATYTLPKPFGRDKVIRLVEACLCPKHR